MTETTRRRPMRTLRLGFEGERRKRGKDVRNGRLGGGALRRRGRRNCGVNGIAVCDVTAFIVAGSAILKTMKRRSETQKRVARTGTGRGRVDGLPFQGLQVCARLPLCNSVTSAALQSDFLSVSLLSETLKKIIKITNTTLA